MTQKCGSWLKNITHRIVHKIARIHRLQRPGSEVEGPKQLRFLGEPKPRACRGARPAAPCPPVPRSPASDLRPFPCRPPTTDLRSLPLPLPTSDLRSPISDLRPFSLIPQSLNSLDFMQYYPLKYCHGGRTMVTFVPFFAILSSITNNLNEGNQIGIRPERACLSLSYGSEGLC